MEDLSGVWMRGIGTRLVVDRGGPRVLVIYPDGNICAFERWYVRRYYERLG